VPHGLQLQRLKLHGLQNATPQLPQLKAVNGADTTAAVTSTAPTTTAPAATKGAARTLPTLPKQHCASALVGPTVMSKARARVATIKADLNFMFTSFRLFHTFWPMHYTDKVLPVSDLSMSSDSIHFNLGSDNHQRHRRRARLQAV
jgi:hypothetical protein